MPEAPRPSAPVAELEKVHGTPRRDDASRSARADDARIRAAQTKAALAANAELVLLYWSIGRDILDRQEQEASSEERLGRKRPSR